MKKKKHFAMRVQSTMLGCTKYIVVGTHDCTYILYTKVLYDYSSTIGANNCRTNLSQANVSFTTSLNSSPN